MTTLLPFVLTPLNITVMRLTHDGIPVKSMLVPLVDATAVPDTKPPMTGVPVTLGEVIPVVPSSTMLINFS
jgi:hypothetical protein